VAAVILYPAIDLKDGRCVRLERGEMATATVFNDDPAAQARAFAAAGARWLHVVDLQGAFAGRPVNAAAVDAIVAAVDCPVQLGGGIRDRAAIEAWLDRGVARVILGSAAVHTPAVVREACRAFPGRIAVGLDARDGRIATDGWARATALDAVTLAQRLADAGVAAFIYTDIARDGVLSGPNVEATVALAGSVPVPVIASGGVASLADLAALKAAGGGVLEGVIVGRALYDGRIDLAEALALLAAPGTSGGGQRC
jgi:phosphoribosylformimino-5-aminoimidazole carboxamide ribotide isomerase